VAARSLAEKLGIVAHRVERWLKDNGAGFQVINERNKTLRAEKAKASRSL